jgi:hypothetical protein
MTISTIFVIIMPVAFKNIGWKVYIINASWDVVIVALIVGLVHIDCISDPRLLSTVVFLGRNQREDFGRDRCNIRYQNPAIIINC